jgi:hypothetical protein
MEKIMARFTNFNQLITSSNSNTDDDDEDNEDKKEEDLERDEDSGSDENKTPEKAPHKSPMKVELNDFKEQEPLQKEYIDTTYWKLDYTGGISVDDLLAELE